VFELQINRRASVTEHITFLVHCTHFSYSATGITNWATQQTWLDCFFGFVSLAVQRLPKFCIPTYPVPRFLLPRYISVPSTFNIAFIWASRNSLRLWNCAQYAYSVNFSAPGKVADPCKTRKKTPVQRVRCFSALSCGLTPPTIKPRCRRRWKMHGAPSPPVIRPPNATADHQFVGAQLYFKQLWSCFVSVSFQYADS